jgi:hypothetical protein
MLPDCGHLRRMWQRHDSVINKECLVLAGGDLPAIHVVRSHRTRQARVELSWRVAIRQYDAVDRGH